MTPEEILTHIRNIPNFPKPGIMFKDITTALKNPEVFNAIIENMYGQVKNLEFDYIAAIESRGYLFAAPLAYKMNKGLVLIRKPGKLPAKVVRQEYSLEYGTDALEMHEDAIAPGQKVLLIDDLLATGGTVKAAAGLTSDKILKTNYYEEKNFYHNSRYDALCSSRLRAKRILSSLLSFLRILRLLLSSVFLNLGLVCVRRLSVYVLPKLLFQRASGVLSL